MSKPAQVSANQEATNIQEGMRFKEKTLDLLTLLTAYAGGSSPAMLVVTLPPTPTPTCIFSVDAAEKKRKLAQGGKGFDGAKEG